MINLIPATSWSTTQMNELVPFHAWFENSHSHNYGNSFTLLHRTNIIVTISSCSSVMFLLLWAFHLSLPASHKSETLTAWSSSASTHDWSELVTWKRVRISHLYTYYHWKSILCVLVLGFAFLFCLQRRTGKLGRMCCLWSDYAHTPQRLLISPNPHTTCCQMISLTIRNIWLNWQWLLDCL